MRPVLEVVPEADQALALGAVSPLLLGQRDGPLHLRQPLCHLTLLGPPRGALLHSLLRFPVLFSESRVLLLHVAQLLACHGYRDGSLQIRQLLGHVAPLGSPRGAFRYPLLCLLMLASAPRVLLLRVVQLPPRLGDLNGLL